MLTLATLSLASLWLPVLLAAVFVFVVSSVVHMVLPLHKGDVAKLPDEQPVMDALRASGVKPGHYWFPGVCSMEEMKSPETQARFAQGPVGYLILRQNGMPSMGKSLLQWFVTSLVISLVTGYVATIGLGTEAAGDDVFRLTATVAFLAYAGATVNEPMWKGARWDVAWRFVFDGLLYGLATGAAFAWLWPAA